MHTLYIMDTQKNPSMSATFINSVSGKSEDAADQDIVDGKNGYQTADLKFDENANAGQIYTIDTSTPAKAGRGIAEKTKYRYTAGEWKTYTA